MPLYFGHPNRKGLSVSPALKSLGIDMLRSAPSSVSVIARPLIVQPGYASYVTYLPAFMKAYVEQKAVTLDKQGYPANFPVDSCIPVGHPPLVIDFKGPIPSAHIDKLNEIGFERIRVQKAENIVRFPQVTIAQVKEIKLLNPNKTTPSPINAVNLESFDVWVLLLRVVSNLLSAHTYPAYSDLDQAVVELDNLTEDTSKRTTPPTMEQSASKRRKDGDGNVIMEGEESEGELEEEDLAEAIQAVEITLRRAKPPSKNVLGWGTPEQLPNAEGLFFPYVSDLCTYDPLTVPALIEDYLIQSLGNGPEVQLERLETIRRGWGILHRTDPGNSLSHLCKVLLLAIKSQGRAFPIVVDEVYQGCVLSGSRLFVGLNGQIHRPLSFTKLQEETGSYHMHSVVLNQILKVCLGNDGDIPPADERPDSMRSLRMWMADANTTEEERDEIRKLAVNLKFKGDRYLAVNPQTISRVLQIASSPEGQEDPTLPMHHTALFSKDRIFSLLSAFGYQAPSFMIDNCPKVPLLSSKPPQTLVIRQKPLDIATLDWKKMIETKEIRNNPRNLSRANRDRAIVGNDKIVMWGDLGRLAKSIGGTETTTHVGGTENDGGVRLETDGLEDW